MTMHVKLRGKGAKEHPTKSTTSGGTYFVWMRVWLPQCSIALLAVLAVWVTIAAVHLHVDRRHDHHHHSKSNVDRVRLYVNVDFVDGGLTFPTPKEIMSTADSRGGGGGGGNVGGEGELYHNGQQEKEDGYRAHNQPAVRRMVPLPSPQIGLDRKNEKEDYRLGEKGWRREEEKLENVDKGQLFRVEVPVEAKDEVQFDRKAASSPPTSPTKALQAQVDPLKSRAAKKAVAVSTNAPKMNKLILFAVPSQQQESLQSQRPREAQQKAGHGEPADGDDDVDVNDAGGGDSEQSVSTARASKLNVTASYREEHNSTATAPSSSSSSSSSSYSIASPTGQVRQSASGDLGKNDSSGGGVWKVVTPQYLEWFSASRMTKQRTLDYVVLGTTKSGTSTFYNIMKSHKQVRVYPRQEAQVMHIHHSKLRREIVRHLKTYKPKTGSIGSVNLLGEHSTGYLYRLPIQGKCSFEEGHGLQTDADSSNSSSMMCSVDGRPLDNCPKNIKAVAPLALLIVTMRDPVERTLSHMAYFDDGKCVSKYEKAGGGDVVVYADCMHDYLHTILYGKDSPLRTCLKERGPLAAACGFIPAANAVTQGLYALHLKVWSQFFPPKQFFLFDVTSFDKVPGLKASALKRLGESMGIPFEADQGDAYSPAAARKFVRGAKKGGHGNGPKNANSKRTRLKEHQKTRDMLEEFYKPYKRELLRLFPHSSMTSLLPWLQNFKENEEREQVVQQQQEGEQEQHDEWAEV